MHRTTPPAARGRRAARRFAPLAAATLASAVFVAPALAQDTPIIAVDAVKDAVIVTGLPIGQTTLSVTRPDAQTGSPVAIGQYAGFAFPGLPFSANTTTPTPFNPGGDCWQKGALSLPGGAGMTPDIRSGDTVGVTGGTNVVVPAGSDAGDGPTGPVAGCLPISVYGQNAVTKAAGGDRTAVTVSGTAQPLATGVTVTANDSKSGTVPVNATLATDGTWSAAIPAADLGTLANGTVGLNAVFAVPDVATGAAAHIAGTPLAAEKRSDGSIGPSPNTPPSPPGPRGPAVGRLDGFTATKRVGLSHARRGGIRVAMRVPAGVKIVRIRLAYRGKSTAYLKFLAAEPAGSRQVVRLSGSSFARKLHRGHYTLTVMAGPSRTQLGQAIKAALVVH
jgi:hypothetical protein